METPVVPELDPLGGGELDLVGRAPGTVVAPDELGLVQPVHRLGQGIVVGVASRADRADGLGAGEPLGVADREVLDAPIGMVDETWQRVAPRPDRHFEGVERELRLQARAHLPAHDAAAEGVDDEGRIDEAPDGPHVGQVRQPEAVGGGRREHALDEIGRALLDRCGLGRSHPLGAGHALEPHPAHEPPDLVATGLDTQTPQGLPQLAHAVHPEFARWTRRMTLVNAASLTCRAEGGLVLAA